MLLDGSIVMSVKSLELLVRAVDVVGVSCTLGRLQSFSLELGTEPSGEKYLKDVRTFRYISKVAFAWQSFM